MVRIPAMATVLALSFFLGGTPVVAQSHGHHEDSSFAAMQQRGASAMGVDQYTSVHRFDDLPDGGRITLQRDPSDTVGVRTIRDHLRGIARATRAASRT